MRHARSVALVAATALVVGVVMMVSGAFAQTNAGTFTMAAGSALGVKCPNALSNSATAAKSETVNCAAATPPSTTTPPTTTPPTTTPPTTTPPTTTPPTTTPPTTTPPSSTGTCTNPNFTTSDAEGTDNTDPNDGAQYWWVDNDAWNGGAGPQTLNVCSEQSWYAVSDQTDIQGEVETYPNSEYDVGGRANGVATKPISAYNTITSTFSEDFPTDGSMDAAYDLWLNNWGTEIMIWNEVHGDNTYWLSQGTPITVGGVNYQFVNLGGEYVFIMLNQEKSGTVDILAAFNYLVSQGLVKASDVPTQLEYGVEISATNGTETFPLTGLTFNLS